MTIQNKMRSIDEAADTFADVGRRHLYKSVSS